MLWLCFSTNLYCKGNVIRSENMPSKIYFKLIYFNIYLFKIGEKWINLLNTRVHRLFSEIKILLETSVLSQSTNYAIPSAARASAATIVASNRCNICQDPCVFFLAHCRTTPLSHLEFCIHIYIFEQIVISD